MADDEKTTTDPSDGSTDATVQTDAVVDSAPEPDRPPVAAATIAPPVAPGRERHQYDARTAVAVLIAVVLLGLSFVAGYVTGGHNSDERASHPARAMMLRGGGPGMQGYGGRGGQQGGPRDGMREGGPSFDRRDERGGYFGGGPRSEEDDAGTPDAVPVEPETDTEADADE